MHRVLYFLVKAGSEEQAVRVAQEKFEVLKNRTDTTYDYCKPMVPGRTVAGSDRWTGFQGEPLASRASSDKGREWVEEAIQYTKEHFAENLFAFFTHTFENLEESPETAPISLLDIAEFAKENRDKSWKSGGEEVLEEWPNAIEHLFRSESGGMHRYYAGNLRERNPMEAHIFDFVSYKHLSIADNSFRLENVEEMIEEKRRDVWVVPLDVHF